MPDTANLTDSEVEDLLLQLGRAGRITLPAELRPRLVYELLDEGMSVDEVADIVKGVGPQTAEALKDQYLDGVPAELASLYTQGTRR
ncbi:hypothetical protein MNAB215_5817 [Mycobacterium numidiamassiliense]|uniref:Uncharacterized protein n=1 Tax=Mycobacterium numidiamassiliense TaxID=1841861 RepID=A0A2U3PIL6_9MYCO|nr:hypothetical protein [Mycobacterium numidiamassiliense]SPM43591.1 hypothetical protein MNAB215_5817 [Mycobacterium numidiamassiliense]